MCIRDSDSQDICFVPDGDYAAFLERYTGQPMQPGNFVDEQGHVCLLYTSCGVLCAAGRPSGI